MKKLIKNGTIVTASDTYQADVLIENEIITQIGQNICDKAAEEIDASGKYIFPGGIDPHTHLDMPFNGTVTDDDWASGTLAAAYGGTTTVLDFCLMNSKKTLKQVIDEWHEKAKDKAVIDYGFHLMIAKLDDQLLEELPGILKEEGITSLKVFLAYAKEFLADDSTLFRAFELAKKQGATVMVHCENGQAIDQLVKEARLAGHKAPKYHALTRPIGFESEATKRAIELAHVAGAKLYVVHVSCGAALEEISRAKSKGYDVIGETCPPYLMLDDSKLSLPGFEGAKYVWSPPLRPKENNKMLWDGLKAKQLATIGSDQCSFNYNGKKRLGEDDFSKIPNGGPFIEDRFSVMYSEGVAKGRLTLNEFVEVVATNAAKIFNIYPQKGTIAIGSDADIVIYDPKVERTITKEKHHMNVDYNAFEGMKVQGVPETVLVRGRYVIKNLEFVGKQGSGKYLKRELKKY